MLKNPTEYEIGKTIVFFVRHGERIELDQVHRIPGPGLTKRGHLQAKAVAKEFLKLKGQIDAIYSSTMLRAIETAIPISKAVNAKIQYETNLCEFNKKVWKQELLHPNFWKHYIKYRKAQSCFRKILKKHQGQAIIIVAHGNMMKGIIGKELHIPFAKRRLLDWNFCGVSKFQYDKNTMVYAYYHNRTKDC